MIVCFQYTVVHRDGTKGVVFESSNNWPPNVAAILNTRHFKSKYPVAGWKRKTKFRKVLTEIKKLIPELVGAAKRFRKVLNN